MAMERTTASGGEEAGGDPYALGHLAFAIHGVSCLISGRDDGEAVRVQCGDGEASQLAVREMRAMLDVAQRLVDEAGPGTKRPRSPVAGYRRPESPEEVAALVRVFLTAEFGMKAIAYEEDGPIPASVVVVDLRDVGDEEEVNLLVYGGRGYGRVLSEDERTLVDLLRAAPERDEAPAAPGEGRAPR